MRVVLCALVVVVALVAAQGVAWGNSITIDAGSAVYTEARDTTILAETNWSPGSTGSQETTQGDASSSIVWAISTSGLSFTMDHQTAGGYQSIALSEVEITFTIDFRASYALSGEYVFGTTGSERAFLFVRLVDLTNGTLFHNTQQSRSVSGGSFEVGGEDANYSNHLTGNLTGLLDPGQYRLEITAYVHNYPADGTYPAFFGDGSVALAFSNPVPEPSTLALLGLSMAGLAVMRRRRSGTGLR